MKGKNDKIIKKLVGLESKYENALVENKNNERINSNLIVDVEKYVSLINRHENDILKLNNNISE